MSDVQDEFSAIITKALVTLVLGLETKFDAEMAAMTRVPWGSLEAENFTHITTPIFLQLASSLGPQFYANVFKCKHIKNPSPTGSDHFQDLYFFNQLNTLFFFSIDYINHKNLH